MATHKLLVLDVDGTLIGYGAYPSPRVAAAITAAKAKGVAVSLGTGRAAEACYHLFRYLNLNGLHVVSDGAAVIDWPSNDVTFVEALPPRAAERLIELSREYDLFLEIYAHDFYFIEKDGQLAQQQHEKLQIKPLVADLMSLVRRVKIVKAQLLAVNQEEKQRADLITQEMNKLCRMSWSLDPTNNIYFGNAIARYVSKGVGVQHMIAYQSITPDQTIAIGDSFNDLPVFEVVGTKIAMGHAPDSLKEIADWVAPTVEEDGVAVAIEKFIL